MRPKISNAMGCIIYYLTLNSDEPIEYAYVKIQFPNKIDDYKLGTATEAEMAGVGRVSADMLAAGKNEKGECVIKGSLKANVDMQASAAGHMITIHASKLPPQSAIVGMVATQEGQTFIQPAPKMFTEGAYEYIKLGHIVRKPVLFIDSGITDLK